MTVRNAVIRFIREEVPWVYMYGPPGNGKTHLAAAAANHLIAQGQAVLFATAPEQERWNLQCDALVQVLE